MESLFPIVSDNFPPNFMGLHFSIDSEPLQAIEIDESMFLQVLNILDDLPAVLNCMRNCQS